MKVFKWDDDDLAVLLPQELIDRLGLKEGDDIEIVAAKAPVAATEAGTRHDDPQR